MKMINYDFSTLEKIMFNFKTNPKQEYLNQIKFELNKFFKDSKCKDVIYTKNTDKPFFGMCVIPYVSGDMAVKILTSEDKIRVDAYYVEIDSKLLDIYFTKKELVAMLLHEVGHLVNNAIPTEDVKNAVDMYLLDNNENLVINKSVQYRDVLAYGIKSALINFTSLFKKPNEEIIADQFSVMCGYGPDLESAYRKISRNVINLNKGVPKLVALQWTLRLYKDLKFKRVNALHTINKMKNCTGSKLQQRELANLQRRLNQIDDNDLINEAVDTLFKGVNNLYKNFKYKGLRNLEDDLYEINLRVKNCDEQDEALTLLRMINTRMSIIDDYTQTEKLDEKDLDRWSNLYNKYNMLRDEMAKKHVYDNKYYGLFIKTPVVKSRYDIS